MSFFFLLGLFLQTQGPVPVNDLSRFIIQAIILVFMSCYVVRTAPKSYASFPRMKCRLNRRLKVIYLWDNTIKNFIPIAHINYLGNCLVHFVIVYHTFYFSLMKTHKYISRQALRLETINFNGAFSFIRI